MPLNEFISAYLAPGGIHALTYFILWPEQPWAPWPEQPRDTWPKADWPEWPKANWSEQPSAHEPYTVESHFSMAHSHMNVHEIYEDLD